LLKDTAGTGRALTEYLLKHNRTVKRWIQLLVIQKGAISQLLHICQAQRTAHLKTDGETVNFTGKSGFLHSAMSTKAGIRASLQMISFMNIMKSKKQGVKPVSKP
jgi:hypothetical protein